MRKVIKDFLLTIKTSICKTIEWSDGGVTWRKGDWATGRNCERVIGREGDCDWARGRVGDHYRVHFSG